jgi:hypothetical protein
MNVDDYWFDAQHLIEKARWERASCASTCSRAGTTTSNIIGGNISIKVAHEDTVLVVTYGTRPRGDTLLKLTRLRTAIRDQRVVDVPQEGVPARRCGWPHALADPTPSVCLRKYAERDVHQVQRPHPEHDQGEVIKELGLPQFVESTPHT